MSSAKKRCPFVLSLATNWSKFRTWGIPGTVSALWRLKTRVLNRRRFARMAAAAPKAAPRPGITLVADFTGRLALSKTMRDFAALLKKAGIPFQVYDTYHRPEIPEEDYRDLLTPKADFDFHKYTHVVELYRSVVPEPLPGHHRVRIVFHDSAAGILDSMPYLDTEDEIIGFSDFNADYFRTSLTRSKKIHKIIYPFQMPVGERTPREEVRAKYGMAADDFVVFFNFDFGSYYRKNPVAAVKAFARAFRDVPRAKLLFKTKNARQYPERLRELETLAAEHGVGARFITLNDYLPRRDVDGLTDACDVYLSLHKSEGFGIGIAEAMALGHPAVATNWSANTEFCRPDNSMPVPYKLVPIKPWEYVECLKEWAEADVDAAAVALRRLYDDPALRAELGRNARQFIAEHFSVANFKRSVEDFLNA